jgi:hypothetical protein
MEDYVNWMDSEDVRPYVCVRSQNKVPHPGRKHKLDWFRYAPVYIDPLDLSDLDFIEQIYYLEGKAFGPTNMAMPRWVFYDCAVMPGFTGGFAIRTSKLPPVLKRCLQHGFKHEWTPVSLFIMIPTMTKSEWVAHNLCSINSILPKEEQFYGLGFLSKAFGLWYANVEALCGMTQWGGPAIKLHSHYGTMELLSSYSPVHSYAKTLTYRLAVDPLKWEKFFLRVEDAVFDEKFEPTGLKIDPLSEPSMIETQHRIEKGEGPFFLSAAEIGRQSPKDPLTLYVKK